MNNEIVKEENYKISEMDIFNVLKEIGVPCNLSGYRYIKAALRLIETDETLIYNLVKGLYVEIAKVYNTTGSRVERAIRHAVEKSFEYGGPAILEEIFGMSYDPNKGKPTNGEFLANIYEYLKLRNNK